MKTGIKYALLVSVATGLTSIGAARADDSQATTTSSANSANSAGTMKADHKTTAFLKDAARDNDEEVALAEVGMRKAQNPELKSFCQMLQQDHTQAGQQLQPIAQKYGVTLDQSLTHKENREVTKLEKQSGAKFDQEFATLMLKDHEKDIQKYQKAAADMQAPDVKEFAQSMIPKLQQHFQHAETVAKAVGVDQSTISSYSKKVEKSMGAAGSDTSSSTATGSSTTKGDRLNDLKSGSPASQSGTSQAAPTPSGSAR